MANCVTPSIEIFEMSGPAMIPAALHSHMIPKSDAQAIKIGADVSLVRVALIEFAMKRELRTKNRPDGKRGCRTNDMIDRFGVEIATEALELGRQQHRIGMIDLLSRITTTASAPLDASMRVFYLIEFQNSRRVPVLKRIRRHRTGCFL